MEFATGIPGCVGASVAMNAGAYNSDLSAVLKEATILAPNNEIIRMKKDELAFEYRDSFIKKNKGLSQFIYLEETD